MTRLCELAEKWRTDKVKSILHDYTSFYHELLSGRTIRKMLEIGIGNPPLMAHCSNYETGASLFMWEEYLPEAEIYAMDILPEVMINQGRIKSAVVDQSNAADLVEFGKHVGSFDFIVDDGSHDPLHQIISANALVPFLAPGGVYVIEDVASPEIVTPGLNHAYTVHRFQEWRHDDRLIVIQP